MKQTVTLLFLHTFLISAFSQVLPDTVLYNHNNHISGTQWMFTAVHLTDIHLGEDSPDGDYATIGWNDTINEQTTCTATERLRNVVHWINSNADAEKIELVLITGDISDRAEKSGFIMAKQILDSLTIPYVVTNGNHDMWPRVIGDQAPAPFGDSTFSEVFNSQFELLSQELDDWNDGTRLDYTYNPENDMYSMFQNFSFSKGSYRFIVNDFASRYAKPVGVGTMINAKLYNFNGGTYPWLELAISEANPQIENGIVFLQHFPLDDEFLSSTYSFNNSEHDSLIDLIEPYASSFGLCVAGHRHRSKTYDIKRSSSSQKLGTGIETDANFKYEYGYMRLIRFWDYATTSIDSHSKSTASLYPNPMSENGTLVLNETFKNAPVDIVIYDLYGRIVAAYRELNTQEIIIERNHLKAGLYLLEVTSHEHRETIKLMITD